MKKYPFVKQEGLKDCGPASLLMIIMFYKGYVTLEELRNITKTNKTGTNAYNLIEGARLLGFDASGVSAKLEDLNTDNLILPCIAHVIIDKSYFHYVVIYEVNFKKEYLIIADPSTKIKKITFLDFKKIYNDILIILYPIKTLPINKNISIKDFISSIYKIYKSEFIKIGLLSIILTVISIVLSFDFKYFIDSYTNNNVLNLLLKLFLILGIFKVITEYVRNKILILLNTKMDFKLMNDVFEKIISLPFSYYRNRTTGEVISRINDLNKVKDILSRIIIVLFVDFPLAIVSAWLLFTINNTLFYTSCLILFFYMFIVLFTNKLLENKISIIKQQQANVNSYMVESITGIDTVKGLNIIKNIKRKFEQKYISYLNSNLHFQHIYNFQMSCKELLEIFCQIYILYLGCVIVNDNFLTIGELITYITILNYFLNPIKNFANINRDYREAKISLKRVLEMLENNKKNSITNVVPKGDIMIKNLSYTFDNKLSILKNINLKIINGEKILLLGKSGSGKSTLMNLLVKNYESNRDNIFINDIDINDYDTDCYKDNVTYISQQELLYTDTLYNNLTIVGNRENVHKIAKMCYVDEIIKNSNLGFNMVIEENGFNISGGQKQRIVLARALLKNSDYLLIDEGLSQVDINLERKILKNVFNEFKKKTIIVVSHRLDNMDLYDRVIRLDKGIIKEDLRKNA